MLLAAMLWGTTGTAQALGGAEGSPFVVGAARMAIGACGLAVVSRLRWQRPPWGWLLVAAVPVAAYQVSFFAGVARTGVALGAVIAIGSAPVVAGLLAWAIRGEQPQRRWWVATALALAGVALIAGQPDDVDQLGVVLVASAGMGYGVYAVASKYLLETMDPETAMTAVFGIAAILLSPFLIGADLDWLAHPEGVAAIVWLGLGATTLAYLAFARGLAHLPAGTATSLTLSEPAMATVLGVVLLDERPGLGAWAGVVLILAGVLFLGRAHRAL